MRWSSWLGACVIWACAPQAPRDGGDCRTESGCPAPRVVQACLDAERNDLPTTPGLCERAWTETRDEEVAATGAFYARRTGDDAALKRWVERAPRTLQGARILHYWGELLVKRGDVEAAEATLQQALDLRVNRDPIRATNTALLLLELARSRRPADESIWLARIAWEQAELAHSDLMRACTAISLIELLLDLGEFSTASAVIERMDADPSVIWQGTRDSAMARLEAARGRIETAIALFRRASRVDPRTPSTGAPMLPHDAIELVQSLLDVGRLAEARRALDRAADLVAKSPLPSAVLTCRLAAVRGSVELAEDHIDAALATVERGLANDCGHAGRVQLLNVQGEVLQRRADARGDAEDAIAADRAWREAADAVESWRASIPTTQLRSGLVARHRRALELWLDSTGKRGDALGALDVTQRIIGRQLLDRIYQREAHAPATVDRSIDRILNRLGSRRELGVTMDAARGRADLRDVRHDMVAFMSGARSVWAIRHARGRWSITRVGDREVVHRWIDGLRGALDDSTTAGQLGDALFPAGTLPEADAPIMVMLDRELSDVALAGLRVAGKYLVEHAPIVEVLAPDLLFAPLPGRSWRPAIAVGDPRGDLQAAAREVQAAAGSTGGRAYVGAEATRAAVAAGRDASTLHVATHARQDNGEAAFVLHDGALPANEIVAQRIAPRLAVIATCRSQVDDDPAGSLVAAFLAAGAPGVIGVKRSLDDSDGAALMADLYRLHGAEDPVRALALAQRAAIAANRPPGAWATVSFFGVGGWVWH
jgi:tetratricopeptide (TPR) repeat protein